MTELKGSIRAGCKQKCPCPPPAPTRCPLFQAPASPKVDYTRPLRVVHTPTSAPCLLGVGSYIHIQDAIDVSNPGDVVVVCPGTYTESISIGPGLDGLTVVSLVPQAAILQVSGNVAPISIFVSQNVQFLNFTVQGTVGSNDVLRVTSGASATVDGNLFTATSVFATIRFGLAGAGVTGAITNNVIQQYGQYGTVVDGPGGNVRVQSNQIIASDFSGSTFQVGIQPAFRTVAQIQSNQIIDRTTPSGGTLVVGIVAAGVSPGTLIDRNRIDGTGYGIYVTNSGDDFSTGTLVTCNVVTGLARGATYIGIFMDETSTGNTITDNTALGWSQGDLVDISTGGGTCGTGNTWARNKAVTDNLNGCLVKA